MFYKSRPKDIEENFYGLIAILEFVSILFIRTRSSLKFYPKIICILLFMYLFYVNFTVYGKIILQILKKLVKKEIRLEEKGGII